MSDGRALVAIIAACGAVSCGDLETHSPSFTDPTCFRVPIAQYTAPDNGCIRLKDKNGLSLFKLDTSESCGGPDCLRLESGETGIVLAKVRPGPEPSWLVFSGACDEVPECPTE